MPRKSLYDVNAIMEQAVDIFLEHSFHGAVMEEIIALSSNFNNRTPYAAIQTSLGCQFQCEFCMINIINRSDPPDITHPL